jgi:PAS domain S-box-containing protein
MVVNAIVQKRSEEALRTSEERYRAIVEDHQTELICRTNPSLQLTFVNETFCEYYDKPREELIGLNYKSLVFPEDDETIQNALMACMIDQPITHFECRVDVNHTEHWQEWTLRAIYNDSGNLIDFQGVGRDITERKNMEAQLKTAQTHLAQNSRMAAIGELASSVAHQISNPLTTIIAEAQILSHSIPKDHVDYESTGSIISAGWRAQHVIQELLKFSEKPKNSIELVAINETIEKAVLLVGAHLQTNRSTNLIVTLAEGLPDVRGNLQQLEDLWVTLLLLAREATTDDKPHNVKIKTSTSEGGNTILIELSDDGQPIQEDQLAKIFEPQLIPTGLGRGTGIELSLCREIVRQHSGNISVKIVEGHTVFSIQLPGSK